MSDQDTEANTTDRGRTTFGAGGPGGPGGPGGRVPLPRLNWKWMLALGIVYLVGAVLAFADPLVASLITSGLVALAFLVGGSLAMWLAFRNEDGTTGGRLVGGAAGLIAVVFAVALWANPLEGLVSLTITVAVLLLISGIVRILIGFRLEKRKGWGWIVLSGAVSAGLGVYIFATLPEAAMSILGIFLGLELAMAGAAHIALALAAKRADG